MEEREEEGIRKKETKKEGKKEKEERKKEGKKEETKKKEREREKETKKQRKKERKKKGRRERHHLRKPSGIVSSGPTVLVQGRELVSRPTESSGPTVVQGSGQQRVSGLTVAQTHLPKSSRRLLAVEAEAPPLSSVHREGSVHREEG